MNLGNERECPIPGEWRKSVIGALRSGDGARVLSKNQADRDWGAAFPNAWEYERSHAMAQALSVDGITGRHILDMVPNCDTYEFWFEFDARRVLGKIGLLPDGRVIIIFSSHIPRKGDQHL